jgi:hypothetical protein
MDGPEGKIHALCGCSHHWLRAGVAVDRRQPASRHVRTPELRQSAEDPRPALAYEPSASPIYGTTPYLQDSSFPGLPES